MVASCQKQDIPGPCIRQADPLPGVSSGISSALHAPVKRAAPGGIKWLKSYDSPLSHA